MVNMKNFYAVTGSPQATLVNIAGIQMAREYYDLPSRTMAGLTDAKKVDFQAGAETMQNLALYTMAGVHMINECLGVMDSITTTSFEKWVLDDELLDRLRVFSAGIDQVAAENRLALGAAGVLVLNLMASPGAGKTSLILSTVDLLPEEIRSGVSRGTWPRPSTPTLSPLVASPWCKSTPGAVVIWMLL